MSSVVGGAVVRAGRVLAARRRTPIELAGRWEFPGGKVEPGESEPEALARELREELALDVRVGALLGRARIRAGLVLAVYLADPGECEPTAGADHDRIRWLDAAELPAVDWLDADRAFLDPIAAELRRP